MNWLVPPHIHTHKHNTSEHLSKGKGETTPLVFKYFYLQNALSNYVYTFQGKKGPHTKETHHVWYSQVKLWKRNALKFDLLWRTWCYFKDTIFIIFCFPMHWNMKVELTLIHHRHLFPCERLQFSLSKKYKSIVLRNLRRLFVWNNKQTTL